VGQTVNTKAIVVPIASLAMVAIGAFAHGLATPVALALIVVGSGMFFIGALAPSLSEFQIGPGGFSAKLRDREREMQATLEPDAKSLAHTATWLTGSAESGRELVEQALIETYLRWPDAKRDGATDAVRKRLVDLAPPPAEEPRSQASSAAGREGIAPLSEALAKVAGLPVDDRSALVLQLVEGFGADAVGAISGKDPAVVGDAVDRGAKALVSALGLDSEGQI
jgi:DNA-directed RNA polymerase specialized sigma24 family protein